LRQAKIWWTLFERGFATSKTARKVAPTRSQQCNIMKKFYKLIIFSALLIFLLSGCASTPTRESLATYDVNGIDYVSLVNLCNVKGIGWDYDIFARTISLTKNAHKIDLMLGDTLVLVDGRPSHIAYPIDVSQGMVVLPYSFKEQVFDSLFREYYPERKLILKALKIKKVVIDAGHGGEDPGALGRGGLKEKDVNLDVARRLANILRADGVEVVMTRSSDRFISLLGRVSIANSANADLFISIHSNANRIRSMNGFEVYYVAPSFDDPKRAYNSARSLPIKVKHFEMAGNSLALKAIIWDMIYTSNQAESVALSRSICRSMDDNSDSRIIGIKGARFAVLKGTRMPAVLVETGFVSNREEERLLKNSYYRQKLAENIAEGIRDFAEVSTMMEVAQR
jgi:N-acetylmuramoyl-L-alanine amidase